MGPRLGRRGNNKTEAEYWRKFMLQWGHAWVGVEIRNGLSPRILARALQWGHAWVGVEIKIKAEAYRNAM